MPSNLFTLHRGIKPRSMAMPMHAHGEAQLTFAASGMVQVHTDEGRWLVPPQLAVWVPAGVAHRVEALTDAELWMVHWQPSAVLAWAPSTLRERDAFALRITPLLRSLLEAAFATDLAPDKAELVVRLMLCELMETADAPTFLPWPTSPVGRRLADLAFKDHQNRLDFSELASRAATSVRSASRVFPTETGLTFKAWRQRARIVRAIDRLARGESIARVSAASGFCKCGRVLVGLSAGDGHGPVGVPRSVICIETGLSGAARKTPSAVHRIGSDATRKGDCFCRSPRPKSANQQFRCEAATSEACSELVA